MTGAWLPIETAPKDGTEIILWDRDFADFSRARWSNNHQAWLEDFVSDPPADKDVVGETVNMPSHWQPLLAAPLFIDRVSA